MFEVFGTPLIESVYKTWLHKLGGYGEKNENHCGNKSQNWSLYRKNQQESTRFVYECVFNVWFKHTGS